MHLILVGDVILDNARHVPHGESLTLSMRQVLREDVHLSCLAVEGHRTTDVCHQLDKLPSTATHIALSSGLHDALDLQNQLSAPCLSLSDVLARMHDLQSTFESAYRRLKDRLDQLGLPVLVLTISDSSPGLMPDMKTVISLFNDVITKSASMDLNDSLDLRNCLRWRSDYFSGSPGTPSGEGGKLIATFMAGWLESYRAEPMRRAKRDY